MGTSVSGPICSARSSDVRSGLPNIRSDNDMQITSETVKTQAHQSTRDIPKSCRARHWGKPVGGLAAGDLKPPKSRLTRVITGENQSRAEDLLLVQSAVPSPQYSAKVTAKAFRRR